MKGGIAMSRKVDTYRRLRALMLELGHDQTSLGKRTGMSRQQISDRMICKTPWTLEEVYKVCDALFIPIKDVKKFFCALRQVLASVDIQAETVSGTGFCKGTLDCLIGIE
jgi:transcriptional regulator with XRE-family HTH domain